MGRDVCISDAGDVTGPSDDESLEAAHSALELTIRSILSGGGIPFVIGGGNDQSFANGLGLLSSLRKGERASVINVDAHLDVRPLLGPGEDVRHSGSPFRQLLEDERFDGSNFVVFAAQGSQCSDEHAKYVHSKGGSIEWLGTLSDPATRFSALLDQLGGGRGIERIFVSFDIDSICGADAPGVSCPATIGLSAREALHMCMAAGKNPAVAMMDVSEFNPSVEEYRTGTLVANMFYYFAMGVAMRKQNAKAAAPE